MYTHQIRVLLVGVQYPHWGNCSGYAQFAGRMSSERFSTTLIKIPLGRDLMPAWLPGVGAAVRGIARRRGRLICDANAVFGELRALGRWMKQGFDIVHFLDGEHAALMLPWMERFIHPGGRRTGFIASFHQPPEILSTLITQQAVSRLDRIVTLAPNQNDFFRQHNAQGRVRTILHGIDSEFFSPQASDTPENGSFTLLTVGKWLRDHDAVRKTVEYMADERKYCFHLVSPGCAWENLPPNVRVSSGISDADLRNLYRNSSLLLLPLRDATANNALLEAAACGLPLLTSNIEAVKAYFGPDAAFWVDDHDPHVLAGAIRTLCENRKLRLSLGRAARQRAEALSWERIAPQFESLYEELDFEITGRRRPA